MEQITKEQVMKVLMKVNDPELRLNIVDLGLVYEVEVTPDNNVGVDMTLTSPACPVGPLMQSQAEAAIKTIEGVNQVDVQIVFDPPWTESMMSERLKKARQMGLL
ncbi:MAG TPA: iron-sulfur cluster assembly protein [Symbiobacteriaceae bacterium]|nr:iron-sulfur cluster assembly protein [Symbiobacteriaceae bacterium]